MDNFLSMAKQGYAAYEESQQSQGQQSTQQQGSQPNQGTQQWQGQGQGTLPVDHGQAAQVAQDQSGDSGNSEMFSQAMALLAGGNHSAPVNEANVTNAHQQVYGGGDASNVSASALGSAAALQTLKTFMSNQGNNSGQGNSGGGLQNQLIGLAMSEAAKTFDQSGNSGDKQEAINGAATTMFKLLVQSKLSSGGGAGNELTSLIGGGNSGGLAPLMGMASKFLN